MIIDFNRYNGGGGSGSGVTPQEVQAQIDSALTPYWDSAATESAITQSVSGKADAVNISGGNGIPKWNSQGIVTGSSSPVFQATIKINGKNLSRFYGGSGAWNSGDLYAPETSGNPGEVLVSTGSGAPVWSAVTIPDMTAYTPTTGFSTINGSAITNGGNIVIQGGGGGDMSAYWNSAQTKSYVDSAATNLQDQIDTMDDVVAAALVDLNDRVYEISASTPTVDLSNYWTSAQTQDAISAATQDMVTSTDVRHIVKLTQAQYDQLATKDPETFYIIINNSN